MWWPISFESFKVLRWLCKLGSHKWFYENDRFRRCERCNMMQQQVATYEGDLGSVPGPPCDHWMTIRAPDNK